MSTNPPLTEQAVREDGLVGVRFPGDPRIVFCVASEVASGPGDWVMLGRNGEERPGRVVIAAGQWSGSPVASGWRLLRALGESGEKATPHTMTSIDPPPLSSAAAEIGSTGPAGSTIPDRTGSGPGSPGGEDERFRHVKRRLPRLGQTVQTIKGDGTVIGVDTVRREVTCVLALDKSEIVVPVDDVLFTPPRP